MGKAETDCKILEFTPADYEAYAVIHNAVYPNYAQAAGDLRHWDEHKDAKVQWRRWLVEREGEIVAFGSYGQMSWAYHPRKFSIELGVHPDRRRRGIGGRLYEHVLKAVMAFDPIVLRGDVRETEEEHRRFVYARGFVDRMRTEESHFDFRAFDPTRFDADLERVAEQGIVIKSFPELADDPDRDRKLHVLDGEVFKDVPSPDPFTPMEFEAWRKLVLEGPRFLPECYMVAVDGNDYVGLSNLWREEIENRVMTGLTGVRRSHRKRGLATALKVRALAAAKAQGFHSTLTWNDDKNKGMLGINFRLGFARVPAWIHVEKVLDAEALAASNEENA